MPYKVGDIVRCKPRWPNQPAFGIWTRDTVLTTEGRIAKVTSAYPGGSYFVQFDRDNDGTFHDCHWGVREDEIVGLWAES
jgi:hypothetical protein